MKIKFNSDLGNKFVQRHGMATDNLGIVTLWRFLGAAGFLIIAQEVFRLIFFLNMDKKQVLSPGFTDSQVAASWTCVETCVA